VTYNGGIPSRTTACATLSPSGSDDTSKIQSAVDACPSGQVVMLGAGTFHVNGNGVQMKSNITLRGGGPGVTTLNSTGSGAPGSLVMMGPLYMVWVDQRTFASDAAKDAYSVKVSDVSDLKVGEVVSVDETYDPALTWYNAASGQTDDYLGYGECRCNHYNVADDTCWYVTGDGCTRQTTQAGALAVSRPIGQAMEISSISGNTVTFTTPFHIAYRMSHAARIARHGFFNQAQNSSTVNSVPVTRAGVEELTMSGGGGGDAGGSLNFFGSSYCWAKHVETTNTSGPAVMFIKAFRNELRDSYIHSTTNPNPGGGGYGITVDAYSADNLVENNISWNFNKVMVMRSSGGGNVIGYNYMQDGWGAGYPTLPEVGINASHMTTPHHELFEGNESHNFASDTTWGNTIFITVYRNHLTGLRRSATPLKLSDQGNRRCAEINQSDLSFSFFGNVLGYSGMPLDASMPGGNSGQTSWQYEPTTGDSTYAIMWQLEYSGATAQSSLLRMGNFDWFTKKQAWPGIGGIGTPNRPPSPLPVLPPSLYIRSTPAFMGKNQWPWVDPSTGNTYTLPARARFDGGSPNTL